ncbi:MAG: glycosyltransferase family 2 protein [Cyanobacteria bacterium P01_F01_bin.86]
MLDGQSISADRQTEISILVPMHNEEPNLSYLFERLESVLEGLKLTYEIICVNDGSKDNTLPHLLDHRDRNHRIKVINLSRNFGKEIALTAAIDHASGQVVVPIDADLQDPPELIAEMLDLWQQGFDVVYATRNSRKGESFIKRLTAHTFYRLMGKLTRVQVPPDTGDFRLMDRQVVNALKQMPERQRFMKGLFAWVGFKQTAIAFDREPRYKGKTNWNYWKLWNFAIDGITAFSVRPLKIWSYVGLFVSSIAIVYAIFLILRTLIFGIDVPGYASLMVVTLLLGGIQLITLGIIGEYLGRVFEEAKHRPLYLVRDCYGFDNYSSSEKKKRQIGSAQ